MNIGIYVYDQAEVLDFSGPFEVFSTAKRLGHETWHVFFVSQSGEPVIARGGFRLLPDYSIQSHPKIDVLLVVGGVHTNEMLKPDVLDWIKSVDQHAQVVASVCTGAFLLANAGLLNGLSVTTHWEDIADLKAQFADLKVVDNKRWVQSGKYITSGGISAGIDMSLHLVSQLTTKVSAEKVAHQMEYNWQKNVK